MFDKSKSAKPLYAQLEDQIRSEIENGTYKPGQLLPREIDYEKNYNLSRITVRQAINNLAEKGLVTRVKGVGTTVRVPKIEEPLMKIKSFTEEMKEKGIEPTTLWAKIMISKSFGEVAEKLTQSEGDEVYRLRRVRCINNIPVVLFDTYIKRYLELELDSNIYYKSLYEYLEEKKGVTIKRVVQRISAEIADKELSRHLDCQVGTAILVLKREAFDQNDNIVEYTIGKYAADRYEYYFVLKE